MAAVHQSALTRFDCIALAEFNKALTLNLPEHDLKALADDLEMESRIRKQVNPLRA